jgi:hypothetical protein
MKRYVFAKPTSREDSDSLLAQFVRFEFDQMDYFMQPHGAGSWALCVNVGSAVEAISKPNYFVQQSNLERIRDFVNVLLVSIGVPQVAPVAPNPALQGYSWPAFVGRRARSRRYRIRLALRISHKPIRGSRATRQIHTPRRSKCTIAASSYGISSIKHFAFT